MYNKQLSILAALLVSAALSTGTLAGKPSDQNVATTKNKSVNSRAPSNKKEDIKMRDVRQHKRMRITTLDPKPSK